MSMATYKQPHEMTERFAAVGGLAEKHLDDLANFFEEAAKTDARFEHEADFYRHQAGEKKPAQQ